jgi:hypothetical protein
MRAWFGTGPGGEQQASVGAHGQTAISTATAAGNAWGGRGDRQPPDERVSAKDDGDRGSKRAGRFHDLAQEQPWSNHGTETVT